MMQKTYVTIFNDESVKKIDLSEDRKVKIKMNIKITMITSKTLTLLKNLNISTTAFYTSTQDILLSYLDFLYDSSINAADHIIFINLTLKFEQ